MEVYFTNNDLKSGITTESSFKIFMNNLVKEGDKND
jgi:hypothetical protein